MSVVANTAFVFGHRLDKDAIDAMAEVLCNAGWTVAELEYAAALIPSDEELCQTVTYNRTINPTVFAKARTSKVVMKGRPFSYDEAIRYGDSVSKPMHEVFNPYLVDDKTIFVMKP